jgi:hypothetical protein
MSSRGPGKVCLLCLALAVSWTGGAPASSARSQSSGDDRTLSVAAVRTVGSEFLVKARDLEQMGLVSLSWGKQSHVGILAAGDVTMEFRPGRERARVTVIARSGRPVETEEALAVPAELSEGQLLVPLVFVCDKLGVAVEARSGGMLRLGSSVPALAEARPAGRAPAAVLGRVVFNGRPLPGVVLRLVKASDSTFVPDLEARTDANGRYRFAGLPPDRYRVYAYVRDNPDYFNRETATFSISGSDVVAPTISMGRIVRPVSPLPEARISFAKMLPFIWTACPGAASYEFTVTDPETHEEVALKTVQTSEAEVPGSALTPGRRYQCRVLALSEHGGFLGATPGMGAPAWTVVMIISADPGDAGDSEKGD